LLLLFGKKLLGEGYFVVVEFVLKVVCLWLLGKRFRKRKKTQKKKTMDGSKRERKEERIEVKRVGARG